MNTISPNEFDLYKTILKLENTDECYAFFHDLCTPAEILAMQERLLIAKLLFKGGLSYQEIHKKTGVSISTIGRVARFLRNEPYGGYRDIFSKSQ